MLRVGQDAIVFVRFKLPPMQAALSFGEIDLEGDGQPGWSITGVGIDRIAAITIRPTHASVGGPFNLLGRVRTVEGCTATTGLRRIVTVTP